MGSALSGGQQQRLLLARALYAQPSILILDEATSHLDIATEQAIAAMLASLKITRIFAAHRPETIAIADRTIHLESPATVRTRQAAVSANGNSADPYLHNKFGSPNGPKTEKGELHVKHESEASP
jgi:ATP-binding cassette, subfamily B, bacterial CvaB/MchF/RaxB